MNIVKFSLRLFGWIPVPKFTLKLLPKKYKKRISTNLLNQMEEDNLIPEFVSVLLDKLEEIGYKYSTGSKFKNTEEEVNEAIKNLPQLKPYRIYFSRYCERKRKEVGLPV